MEKKPARNHEQQQPTRSRSYILRLWCTDEPEAVVWHASLEDPFTRERLGFSSLEQLFAFLMELSERDRGGRDPAGRFGGTPEENQKGGAR